MPVDALRQLTGAEKGQQLAKQKSSAHNLHARIPGVIEIPIRNTAIVGAAMPQVDFPEHIFDTEPTLMDWLVLGLFVLFAVPFLIWLIRYLALAMSQQKQCLDQNTDAINTTRDGIEVTEQAIQISRVSIEVSRQAIELQRETNRLLEELNENLRDR